MTTAKRASVESDAYLVRHAAILAVVADGREVSGHELRLALPQLGGKVLTRDCETLTQAGVLRSQGRTRGRRYWLAWPDAETQEPQEGAQWDHLGAYEEPAALLAAVESALDAALAWPLPPTVRAHLERAMAALGECKRRLAESTGYPYAERDGAE
jgi:hypothetical protein